MPIVDFKGDSIEFPYDMMIEEIDDVMSGLLDPVYQPQTEVGKRAMSRRSQSINLLSAGAGAVRAPDSYK